MQLTLLTHHCNGDCAIFVRKLIIVCNFNPEMKRSLVTGLKGINLQWTVLLRDVSQQLCPMPILLHHFRLNWVIGDLIWRVGPQASEFSERLPWIWVVIWAGNHHTGSRETFNWGRHLNCPSRGLSHCNKMQRKMWWNETQKTEVHPQNTQQEGEFICTK